MFARCGRSGPSVAWSNGRCRQNDHRACVFHDDPPQELISMCSRQSRPTFHASPKKHASRFHCSVQLAQKYHQSPPVGPHHDVSLGRCRPSWPKPNIVAIASFVVLPAPLRMMNSYRTPFHPNQKSRTCYFTRYLAMRCVRVSPLFLESDSCPHGSFDALCRSTSSWDKQFARAATPQYLVSWGHCAPRQTRLHFPPRKHPTQSVQDLSSSCLGSAEYTRLSTVSSSVLHRIITLLSTSSPSTARTHVQIIPLADVVGETFGIVAAAQPRPKPMLIPLDAHSASHARA